MIELYKSIRNLPKFDSNHCPIIGVQTTDDEVDYCLQVHRTRDFQASQIDLNGIKEDEAYTSRGATPAGEHVYDISFLTGHMGESLPKNFQEWSGAYLFSHDPAFVELNLNRRGVHLINTKGKNDRFHAMGLAAMHCNRSEMFKPPVSIQLPIKDILRKDEMKKVVRDPTSLSIPVKITSDGKRAIVERV
ncbi:MAG: hypothetical protein KAS32_22800 [Candidatus Peribacteraceae bacterium]|nr:hypothetical protein [Candidatus Peribacteraceae bacterium]